MCCVHALRAHDLSIVGSMHRVAPQSPRPSRTVPTHARRAPTTGTAMHACCAKTAQSLPALRATFTKKRLARPADTIRKRSLKTLVFMRFLTNLASVVSRVFLMARSLPYVLTADRCRRWCLRFEVIGTAEVRDPYLLEAVRDVH